MDLLFFDFWRLTGEDVQILNRMRPGCTASPSLSIANDDVSDLLPGETALPSLRDADEFAAAWLPEWFRRIADIPGAKELAHFRTVPVWEAARLSLALELYRPVGAAWRALRLLSSQRTVGRVVVLTDSAGPGLQGRALLYLATQLGLRSEIHRVPRLHGSRRSAVERWRSLRARTTDWSIRNVAPLRSALLPAPAIPEKRGPRVLFAQFFGPNVPALVPVYQALERMGEVDLLWLAMRSQVVHAVNAVRLPVVEAERVASRPCRAELGRRLGAIGDALETLFTNAAFPGTFAIEGVPLAPLLRPVFRHTLWHVSRTVSSLALWTRHAIASCEADVVVTANDTSLAGQTLAFVCRDLGVPLVYVQHGVIPFDPYATAGRADILLVWGEVSRRALMRLGNSPEQLWLMGSAQYDAFFSGEQSAALPPTLHLVPHRPLVVFTSQPAVRGIPESTYRRTIRAVVAAAAELVDVRFVVKLHPVERPEGFRDVLNELNGLDVQVVKACDTRALIGRADVVVTQYSTTGLEALLLGKPLVTINLTGEPDRAPYAGAGAALGVYRAEDLGGAIDRALRDPETRHELAVRREAFLADMFLVRDGSASERCARAILDILRTQAPKPAPATLEARA